MSDLTCYSLSEANSKGRKAGEPVHPYRSGFQRDRDRIIHSEAFRRLEGKTQVFTPGINDHFRTRLTHSIEVAQIGRTISRSLNLNEDLTEAVCLGHDIGHAPFGHDGEKMLNELMQDAGGFEHNRQALRIVDNLENPYPDRPGLNLLYETRQGFAMHSSQYDQPGAHAEFDQKCPSLEAQIVDLADRIAYNCHDLEDGLRARILCEGQLEDVPIFQDACGAAGASRIENSFVRRTRIAKAVVDILVTDCIDNSHEQIRRAGPKSIEDVYASEDYLVMLSADRAGQLHDLERFLQDNLYRSDDLMQYSQKARESLGRLFDVLVKKPEQMPLYYRQRIEDWGLKRSVCDYIAGMTDTYCQRRIEELT